MRIGTWQAVSPAAVDQGRGGAGDSGDGRKWADPRDNQGVKLTGHGDKFNTKMRERRGFIAECQVCVLQSWVLVVPAETGHTGREPGLVTTTSSVLDIVGLDTLVGSSSAGSGTKKGTRAGSPRVPRVE